MKLLISAGILAAQVALLVWSGRKAGDANDRGDNRMGWAFLNLALLAIVTVGDVIWGIVAAFGAHHAR